MLRNAGNRAETAVRDFGAKRGRIAFDIASGSASLFGDFQIAHLEIENLRDGIGAFELDHVRNWRLSIFDDADAVSIEPVAASHMSGAAMRRRIIAPTSDTIARAGATAPRIANHISMRRPGGAKR
jgi:hypothetical protein